LTNGSLARLFWRLLDALDYRLTQARLWLGGRRLRTRAGAGSAAPACSEGADLTRVLGGARGRASRIEVICSDLVPRSEIKYLLPRTRKATARYVAKLGRQLSVMLAIYWQDGPRSFFRG
jgi:hypothetical protein